MNTKSALLKELLTPEQVRGADVGTAKLTEAAVMDMRTYRYTQKVYARMYGVCVVSVHNAQTGKTWAHLPPYCNENVS